MKRVITLCIAMMATITAYATQPYTAYCSLTGTQSISSANGYIGSVEVDYGQESLSKRYLVDEDGKRLNFNSMIGAMNYMAQFGWKFDSCYTTVVTEIFDGSKLSKLCIVWIITKEVTSDEEICEGFLTRHLFEERR